MGSRRDPLRSSHTVSRPAYWTDHREGDVSGQSLSAETAIAERPRRLFVVEEQPAWARFELRHSADVVETDWRSRVIAVTAPPGSV